MQGYKYTQWSSLVTSMGMILSNAFVGARAVQVLCIRRDELRALFSMWRARGEREGSGPGEHLMACNDILDVQVACASLADRWRRPRSAVHVSVYRLVAFRHHESGGQQLEILPGQLERRCLNWIDPHSDQEVVQTFS